MYSKSRIQQLLDITYINFKWCWYCATTKIKLVLFLISQLDLILIVYRYTITTQPLCFLKIGQPRPLFRLISVFSNKQYNFNNKSMSKCLSGFRTHDLTNMSHHPKPLDQGSRQTQKKSYSNNGIFISAILLALPTGNNWWLGFSLLGFRAL